MIGLLPDSCIGTLTVDSTDLCTPAWLFPDLRELWLPASVRGQDRLIPGAGGILAKRRRRTVTTHDLPFTISGECDEDGVLATPFTMAGIQAQLETNIATLRSTVIDPTGVGDGTRAATLTLPSGGTRSADIHVLGLTILTAHPKLLECLFHLSIPSGVFA